MIENNLPALQVVITLVAAPICAMLPRANIAWLFTSIATALAFAVSIMLTISVYGGEVISYEMGNWKAPFGIVYQVDMLSALMLVLISGMGFIVALYGYSSVKAEIEKEKRPLFYSTYLLCLSGLLGIVITNDAFNVYVFLEISSLATYALIAMGKDRRALLSSFEYLILGTIGATFILIGIGLIYSMLGTLNINDMASKISLAEDSLPIKAALVFFVIGVALKIAMFPLHLWLVNSYTNAPSMASSFLSATATKVGIYVLIRVIYSIFGAEYVFAAFPLGKILVTFGVLAILAGSMVAMFQDNVKRMLAYSSVAQIGYIILAIGLKSELALAAALIHICAHAISKGALFMSVGCVSLQKEGSRFSDFKGVGKEMPMTMMVFVIAGLSLVGVPFTAGFISKWYLLQASLGVDLWLVFILLIFSSLLALIYIWRVVEYAFFMEPDKGSVVAKESGFSLLIPMWALIVAIVFFGVYSSPITKIAMSIAQSLIGINISNQG
ncbi:monovalent cation/H+ antiporter subunit D family protein [Rickettsiales bacterium]|nr:monovalent cation/H+ antiporter subunit D family protein [Rickettsiales bacterium]